MEMEDRVGSQRPRQLVLTSAALCPNKAGAGPVTTTLATGVIRGTCQGLRAGLGLHGDSAWPSILPNQVTLAVQSCQGCLAVAPVSVVTICCPVP